MKKKKRVTLPGLYLGLVLFLMYLPVAIVMVYSFNSGKTDVRFVGLTLDWYYKMLQNKSLMAALENSLILGFSSCLISAVIGTLGAVGLAKSQFRAKGVLENIAILPIMIPEIILGMVFLAFFSFFGLKFGMTTLIIAHTVFCVPYIFIVVKGRLAGLPKEVFEAARDLGANEMRAFWDITLPLIAPAVLSGSLLAFAMSLDDVVLSFFVTGASVNTLPIKIYSQIKLGVSPEINALCTVMLVVVFLLVFFSSALTRERGQSAHKQKG